MSISIEEVNMHPLNFFVVRFSQEEITECLNSTGWFLFSRERQGANSWKYKWIPDLPVEEEESIIAPEVFIEVSSEEHERFQRLIEEKPNFVMWVDSKERDMIFSVSVEGRIFSRLIVDRDKVIL